MLKLLRVHTNQHGVHINQHGEFANANAAWDFVRSTGLELADLDSAWLLVPNGQVQQMCNPVPDGYYWEDL